MLSHFDKRADLNIENRRFLANMAKCVNLRGMREMFTPFDNVCDGRLNNFRKPANPCEFHKLSEVFYIIK